MDETPIGAFLEIDSDYRAMQLFTLQSYLWNEGARRLLQLLLPPIAAMLAVGAYAAYRVAADPGAAIVVCSAMTSDRAGVDVLIGTPGRLIDYYKQGVYELTAVEVLVIDEADRMFDMGFLPPIREILRHLPSRRQTLLFSATMPIARISTLPSTSTSA